MNFCGTKVTCSQKIQPESKQAVKTRHCIIKSRKVFVSQNLFKLLN